MESFWPIVRVDLHFLSNITSETSASETVMVLQRGTVLGEEDVSLILTFLHRNSKRYPENGTYPDPLPTLYQGLSIHY